MLATLLRFPCHSWPCRCCPTHWATLCMFSCLYAKVRRDLTSHLSWRSHALLLNLSRYCSKPRMRHQEKQCSWIGRVLVG